MELKIENVCRVDVHKKYVVTTIMTKIIPKETKMFGTTTKKLLEFNLKFAVLWFLNFFCFYHRFKIHFVYKVSFLFLDLNMKKKEEIKKPLISLRNVSKIYKMGEVAAGLLLDVFNSNNKKSLTKTVVEGEIVIRKSVREK